MSNVGLGVLVGFLVTVSLSIMYPGVGFLFGGFVGGIIAGLVAKGALGGTMAGLLSGIFSSIAVAILTFLKFMVEGAITNGALGFVFGGLAGLGLGIIVLVVGILVSLISASAGLIGGAITR